jgi:hypothetical protein
MIYCSSGSDFEKVSVPDPHNIYQMFSTKIIGQNIAFSMLEAALFTRKLASYFRFSDFFIQSYVGYGSKSGSGTKTTSRT